MATPPKSDKPADKPKAKPVAKAAPGARPKPKLVAASAEGMAAEPPKGLRKKEFLERVGQLTGAKNKDVKPIVEAALKVLGQALAAGEAVTLPDFGNAKVNRKKETPGGEVMIVRLRQPNQSGGPAKAKPGGAKADEALADEDE